MGLTWDPDTAQTLNSVIKNRSGFTSDGTPVVNRIKTGKGLHAMIKSINVTLRKYKNKYKGSWPPSGHTEAELHEKVLELWAKTELKSHPKRSIEKLRVDIGFRLWCLHGPLAELPERRFEKWGLDYEDAVKPEKEAKSRKRSASRVCSSFGPVFLVFFTTWRWCAGSRPLEVVTRAA